MVVPGGERVRLDSWKEIAEYLGRDVRTVVRWEKDKGLPIHTVPGLRRRSVFAYTDELDTWLAGSPQIDEQNHGASGTGDLTQEEAWSEENGHPEAQQLLARRASQYRFLIFAGTSFALVLLVAYVVFTVRANLSASSAVEQVTLRDGEILALNKNGRTNWRHRLDAESRVYQTATLVSFVGEAPRDDCLVSLAAKADNPTAYWLFASDGKLLWKYSPTEVVTFGNETYSPPWTPRGLYRTTFNNQKRVLLALAHHTWWPSIVVLLGEQGRPLRQFVNSGWITFLAVFEGPQGPLIAAGGANNAHNGGAVAILDPEQFAGSSPEEKGSAYECLSCEPGRPLKYFVFPRSELNVATGSTFNFAEAYFRGDRLIVKTHEEEVAGDDPFAAALYEFSPELKLLRASFGDRYWDLHRKLESEGKITHTQAECPDRNGPRLVRSWDAREGWKEIHPN